MIDLTEVRHHVTALRARGVSLTGHRGMLARCLDEIDALEAQQQMHHQELEMVIQHRDEILLTLDARERAICRSLLQR